MKNFKFSTLFIILGTVFLLLLWFVPPSGVIPITALGLVADLIAFLLLKKESGSEEKTPEIEKDETPAGYPDDRQRASETVNAIRNFEMKNPGLLNTDLEKKLNASVEYLLELREENWDVPAYVFDGFENFLDSYYEIALKKIQTEKTREALSNAIKTLDELNLSLAVMYDSMIEQKSEDIEMTGKAIESKLKLDNLHD